MDAGARLHARAARSDEAARRRPGLRRVGAVLPGDGVRARAARLVHPGDELRAGAVARLPAVARLRGDDRTHRQHVLGQPARGVGDRRRVPARVPAPDGRDRHRVALNSQLRRIATGPFVVTVRIVGPALPSAAIATAATTTGRERSMCCSSPEAGGAYVFVRDSFGPLLAFLLGCPLFFVISSGSVATLAVAFADYLRQFVPLDPTARKLAVALMIAVVGAVNVRGTRHSANIQN